MEDEKEQENDKRGKRNKRKRTKKRKEKLTYRQTDRQRERERERERNRKREKERESPETTQRDSTEQVSLLSSPSQGRIIKLIVLTANLNVHPSLYVARVALKCGNSDDFLNRTHKEIAWIYTQIV